MVIAVTSSRSRVLGHEAFQPLDIDVDHCKGCGLCVDVCPKHVLELDTSVVNELGYHPIRLTDAAAARAAPSAPGSVPTPSSPSTLARRGREMVLLTTATADTTARADEASARS